MPHFTRYLLFRERKSLNKCSNKTQNRPTKQPDLFFYSLFLCFPPQRTIAWLVSLCSRSGSRQRLIIQALLHFSPHQIFFSLKFPHTHSHTYISHTHLVILFVALAARLLPCGSVARVFSVTESRGCRPFTTQASMRAGSQFPACLAHPSETWDVLTLVK